MVNAILIPSYRPDEKIIQVVIGLFAEGFENIVVVNDGSGVEYEPIFCKLLEQGCKISEHRTNQGKGAAIKTGIEEMIASNPKLDYIITVDGDGQHSPKDVKKIWDTIKEQDYALWLGERNFSGKGIPLKSRIGNGFSSLYFRLHTGEKCPDTQTGLRAIPRTMFALAMETEGNRYEYEMFFLWNAAKKKMLINYIPIETIYEDGNKTSHFRAVKDSYLIYGSFFRFLMVASSSALIDLVLFSLFLLLPWNGFPFQVFMATVFARILSGLYNFYLNHKWSFQSTGSKVKNFQKYLVLFFLQMFASGILVNLISFSVSFWATGIKIFVDIILFFISYFIQLNWVFRKPTAEPSETKMNTDHISIM